MEDLLEEETAILCNLNVHIRKVSIHYYHTRTWQKKKAQEDGVAWLKGSDFVLLQILDSGDVYITSRHTKTHKYTYL